MRLKVKWGKILYFISGVMLLIFFLITPTLVMPKLLHNGLNSNFTTISNDGGFLKLWHIDDFEGGSGNRATFLENVSKDFEKKHHYSVIVQNITAEEAYNALTHGTIPDLISFSHHSGFMLENILNEYTGKISVRHDLVAYAKSYGKTLAIPWYLSGYCLIGNSEINPSVMDTLAPATMFSYGISSKRFIPSLSVGLANSSLALLATLENDAQVGDLMNINANYDNTTTFEAYSNFCTKNSSTVLLGTARDYYRVQNKISLGTMPQCKFVPLGGFSDLVGYIGITSTTQSGLYVATKFIEHLTSTTTQSALATIGLFSTTFNEIYKDNSHYSAFEKVLHRPLSSIKLFMPPDEKDKLWRESINATLGDVNSLKYVKKYI